MNEPRNHAHPVRATSERPSLIPAHGGYRSLRSFRAAQAVYDGTIIFCDRFIDRRSRTHDQMVQAARSGLRNIEEGSVASATSKKTELKLTNVARASLEELLRDYEDFLRHNQLPIWDKNSERAKALRLKLQSDMSDLSDQSDSLGLRSASAEICANTMLCLTNQASYLLRRQLDRLETDFLENGGFTERLYSVRTKTRAALADQPTSHPPKCPVCEKPMLLRTARTGKNAGSRFFGCSGFPGCKGTRPADVS